MNSIMDAVIYITYTIPQATISDKVQSIYRINCLGGYELSMQLCMHGAQCMPMHAAKKTVNNNYSNEIC